MLQSGFRKRGRRNGVASDFLRFLPFFPCFFPLFFLVFFPFLPFSSVFSSVFFPFSSVFSRFIFRKNRETPFARPLLRNPDSGGGPERVTTLPHFLRLATPLGAPCQIPLESIMCKWTRPFWGTDCRRAPKGLPRLRQPLFAARALIELDSACRVSILLRCCRSTHGLLFRALRRSLEGVSSSL